MINKPRVSKAITRMYIGIAVFIAVIALLFIYLAFFTPAGIVMLGASFALLFLLEPLFILLIRSIYNTRYILSERHLVIDTSALIGGRKKIQLNTIENVEKTLYPFGIKLFGASFHGGYYKIPGLGRAFLAITNFDDGILIRTKEGNYIITPSNPAEFINSLNHRIIHTYE